jgi:hypothetical protein
VIAVGISSESNSRYSSSQRGDFLAWLPWLLLPYDSLTHLLGVGATTSQTLPLTALLAIPYLVLRGRTLRSTRSSSIVFYILLTAFMAMFVVTAVNALIEYAPVWRADFDARMVTWPRQSISMLLGLSSYLMFQDTILRLGIPGAARGLLWGCAPSVMLGAFQIFSGDYRAQGFSTEPSHMADMLVFAFLPACAVADVSVKIRRLLALVGIALLIATFSTTGYLKALAAVLVFIYLSGKLVQGGIYLLSLLVIGYIALNVFSGNYVFTIVGYMFTTYEQTGQLGTGSFIDRFFGFVGPLSQLNGLHGWLGYGFGGDAVYFDRLFDEETAAAIREVKGEILSISSLQGKMLMYGGVAGYLLYLYAWKRSLYQVPRAHIARVMIPTVFASSLFSLGPLFLPYVWLWLSIGACASGHIPAARRTKYVSRILPPQ